MRDTIRRITLCIILSLGLTGLLSLVPLLMEQKEPALPATAQGVTTQAAVDLVAQHDRLPLKRMDRQGERLFFDLEQQQLTEEELYRETYLLLRNLFLSMPTVQEVRLLLHPNRGKAVRIIATRKQLQRDPMMENRQHLSAKEYLQKMFTWN